MSKQPPFEFTQEELRNAVLAKLESLPPDPRKRASTETKDEGS